MAFQDAVEAAGSEADTDESAPGEPETPRGDSTDPFSMTWQTERYDVTDQQVDRALGVLVALTNLL